MTSKPPALDVASLADAVAGGQRRALAQAITLAESDRPEDRITAEDLLTRLLPRTGGSLRLGISGPPGAGKSTFIEAFGRLALERGYRLAVLAVDPTSRRSGGSILGDKTRMAELSRDPRAYIRPQPSGLALGGVARRSREALLLCEAAGFDLVIVETVGVGQSETAVAEIADIFLLLLPPAAGDDLQGIKRGIVELADLVVINKADGDLMAAATRTAGDYANALHLMQPRHADWVPEVLTCSALEGRGIDTVLDRALRAQEAISENGGWGSHRRHQASSAFHSALGDVLRAELDSDPGLAARRRDLALDVAEGRLPPEAAARRLVREWLGRMTPPNA